MLKDQSCETCQFYRPYPRKTNEGRCVRYPPKIVGYNISTICEFPEVHDYEWCGEFKHVNDPKGITVTA